MEVVTRKHVWLKNLVARRSVHYYKVDKMKIGPAPPRPTLHSLLINSHSLIWPDTSKRCTTLHMCASKEQRPRGDAASNLRHLSSKFPCILSRPLPRRPPSPFVVALAAADLRLQQQITRITMPTTARAAPAAEMPMMAAVAEREVCRKI